MTITTKMIPTPMKSYVPLFDTPNNKRGYFVYDGFHFVPGRAVYFQFGNTGYGKVMILNSIPNPFVPSGGGSISLNLGPLSFSIGTNTSTTPNYNINTSYNNPNPYSNPMGTGMNNSMGMGMNNSMNMGSMNNSMSMGMNTSMNPTIGSSVNYGVNVNRGESFGRRHGDTRSFDHFNIIPKSFAPIRQINIWGTNSHVNGIQVIYDGGITTPLEVGYHENPMQQCLNLQYGEFVTDVSGTSGDLIDSLEIRTNLGKSVRVGGYGGVPFRFNVPYNTQIVGFYGGVGGHLHNIGIYYM